jgi:hypothetical protein
MPYLPHIQNTYHGKKKVKFAWQGSLDLGSHRMVACLLCRKRVGSISIVATSGRPTTKRRSIVLVETVYPTRSAMPTLREAETTAKIDNGAGIRARKSTPGVMKVILKGIFHA